MKIQQKVGSREVTFSSLGGGDTFRAVESDPDVIWMKTEYIEVGEDDDGYNVVDLSNGEMGWFDHFERVIPVTVIAAVED